ncbi:response regulator transcription factor [Alteromonas lipolytica]|uniref:DNA-binding response regulator n=1 Tax=Alteromonas lipolytica TaxID=1856405 RepID=A0A1E8FFE1_9ALTE|nr:response regulator transcription factor [Alteromonas lipolytica]OFI34655.1 DNA-binding response regulator [Alteromonas lipolytica]GGF52945.1 DNA-binding response regulator [Alteromonas lipolytica]
MKILIADDEVSLVNFLYRGLCAEGFECSKETALHNLPDRVKREKPDLLVLDRMFDNDDSVALLPALKQLSPAPMILLLTALDDTSEKVKGLDKGADDYLCKPFDFDELLARVNALGRRPRAPLDAEAKKLQFANLELDLESRLASITENGRTEELSLTNIEFNLLNYFVESQNKVVTRERILSRVWQSNTDPLTNIVDVYISRLRQKLPKATGIEIATIRGNGYRLKALNNTNPS